MQKRYYIYALCLPDGTPFYFGKSDNPKHRLVGHICEIDATGRVTMQAVNYNSYGDCYGRSFSR